MPETPDDSRTVRIAAIWAASLIISAYVGASVLAYVFTEFLDCSNPDFRESANNVGGWLIAGVMSLVPVGVLLVMRVRDARVIGAASAVALVELLLFWLWGLTPCG